MGVVKLFKGLYLRVLLRQVLINDSSSSIFLASSVSDVLLVYRIIFLICLTTLFIFYRLGPKGLCLP